MSRVQRWIVTTAAGVFLALVVLGGVGFYLNHRDVTERREERLEEVRTSQARREAECKARAAARATENIQFLRAEQYLPAEARYFELCMEGRLPR